jgi:hypothetical protein
MCSVLFTRNEAMSRTKNGYFCFRLFGQVCELFYQLCSLSLSLSLGYLALQLVTTADTSSWFGRRGPLEE